MINKKTFYLSFSDSILKMESIVHVREQVIQDYKNNPLKNTYKYIYNLTVTSTQDIKSYNAKNDLNYLNQLYSVFTANEKLLKIIRIIPIYKRKPINIKSYMIYIYTDDFIIYVIDKDNQIIEDRFVFSYNFNDLSFLIYINVSKINYENYLNDDQKLERIYTMIYKYYRVYTNNKIFKDKHLYYKADIYADYYKQLQWDILKNYILTCNYSMLSHMIEKEITNLSLLINLINYQEDYNIEGLDDTIKQWIERYLEWYNGEGKYIINKCKSIYYVYNNTDIDNEYMDPECYMYTCIIEEHGLYEKTKILRITVDNIKILIVQLYYTLAQLSLANGIIVEEDKINILKYLELSKDYKDAKELKKKLFYHYLGFDIGQELNIEIEDTGIIMVYKMAKLLLNK